MYAFGPSHGTQIAKKGKKKSRGTYMLHSITSCEFGILKLTQSHMCLQPIRKITSFKARRKSKMLFRAVLQRCLVQHVLALLDMVEHLFCRGFRRSFECLQWLVSLPQVRISTVLEMRSGRDLRLVCIWSFLRLVCGGLPELLSI